MNPDTCHPDVWAIWEKAMRTKDKEILQQILVDLEKLDTNIVGPVHVLGVRLYAAGKIKNPGSYPD